MELQKTYVTWLAELFPPQGEWTEEGYFALPETDHLVELSGGVLSRVPPPTGRSQRAGIQLLKAVNSHIIANNLGETNVGWHRVRLYPGAVRIPDVWFLHQGSRGHITRRYVDGPPDWVAEVISPETREADEVDKLADYARAGVPEYWLIDPENSTIRVGTLYGGMYTFTVYEPDTAACSDVIQGLVVGVDMVFGA